jgi:hypothetical protein
MPIMGFLDDGHNSNAAQIRGIRPLKVLPALTPHTSPPNYSGSKS